LISAELLIYTAFVLALMFAISQIPAVPTLADYACTLRGDTASLLGLLSVDLSGCSFTGDRAGSVPIFGYVRTAAVVQVKVLRDYP